MCLSSGQRPSCSDIDSRTSLIEKRRSSVGPKFCALANNVGLTEVNPARGIKNLVSAYNVNNSRSSPLGERGRCRRSAPETQDASARGRNAVSVEKTGTILHHPYLVVLDCGYVNSGQHEECFHADQRADAPSAKPEWTNSATGAKVNLTKPITRYRRDLVERR